MKSYIPERMNNMTEKLYYKNPILFEWETEISEVLPFGDHWLVKLKETAFYPEGGGQPADQGLIGEAEVFDVRKQGEEIIHFVDKRPFGRRVHCRVNKNRRIDFTQHHTGQHLLSAVILAMYNIPTVSFHLSPESATIDIDIPELDDEQLRLAEERVNELIFEDRKVHIFYIDESEIPRYQLPKVPTGHKTLRIVEIEGVEYNACGGTHVKRLGELGMLKLLKTEKIRGMTRLYFICGKRLLNDYGEKLALLQKAAAPLSTSPNQLPDVIQKIIEDNKEQARKYQQLFQEHVNVIAQQLLNDAPEGFVAEMFDSFNMKELNILASNIIENGGKIILFGSKTERKVFLTRGDSSNFHCGSFIKEHAKQFEGKGGGSENKAQAVFPNDNTLNEFFNFAQRKLFIFDPN